MVKKNRLGKGLSALLNDDVSDIHLKQESTGKNLISIKVEAMIPLSKTVTTGGIDENI